ncbi:hypothetical protein GCM10022397_27740 [Flavivirga jejuensis]
MLQILFFCFKLFERTRFYDKKIDFHFDKIHCDDIGICLIGEYPRLNIIMSRFLKSMSGID